MSRDRMTRDPMTDSANHTNGCGSLDLPTMIGER